MAYDYYAAKPARATDANGVSTIFAYNDPLDRLTQVTHASGASGVENQTNYSYPGPNQITMKQDQNAEGDGVLTTVQLFDGLGRESVTSKRKAVRAS